MIGQPPRWFGRFVIARRRGRPRRTPSGPVPRSSKPPATYSVEKHFQRFLRTASAPTSAQSSRPQGSPLRISRSTGLALAWMVCLGSCERWSASPPHRSPGRQARHRESKNVHHSPRSVARSARAGRRFAIENLWIHSISEVAPRFGRSSAWGRSTASERELHS